MGYDFDSGAVVGAVLLAGFVLLVLFSGVGVVRVVVFTLFGVILLVVLIPL